MARQYEGGHDEAVGVHHGHRDGPVVRQALLGKRHVVMTVSQVLFCMLEATNSQV